MPNPCQPEAVTAALESLHTHPTPSEFEEIWAVARSIRDESSSIRPCTEAEVSRMIHEADVVLLSDYHRFPYLEKVFVDRIISWRTARERALFLEAVPLDEELRLVDALEDASRGMEGPLHELLQRTWPNPILGYLRELPRLLPAGVGVRAIGSGNHGKARTDVEDGSRVPHDIRKLSWAEWRALQATAVHYVCRWLDDAGSGRRLAFVQFGLAHMLRKGGGLVDRFKSQGKAVLCIVPFAECWEQALFERFGVEVCDNWFEVSAGVLCCPDLLSAIVRGGMSVRGFCYYTGAVGTEGR